MMSLEGGGLSMKIIPLYELCSHDFNINKWGASYQHWNRVQAIKHVPVARPQSGLLYFYGSSGLYDLDGKTLDAQMGDIFYLPPHSKYSTLFTRQKEEIPSSILINLWLTDAEGEEIALSDSVMQVCSDEDERHFLPVFQKIVELATAPVPDTAAVKQRIYRLFSELSHLTDINRLNRHNLMTILPGIEYLKNNAEQSLSIKEVARLCSVSEVYFRRLFKENFGVSPARFRLERKINRAKRLLSTEQYNVTECARMSGFEDPIYFCKIFRRYTGLTPGEYQRVNGWGQT